MPVYEEVAVVPNYVRDALDLFKGFGTEEALVGGDTRLTYADLRQRVPAMAAALLDHGTKPGSTGSTSWWWRPSRATGGRRRRMAPRTGGSAW